MSLLMEVTFRDKEIVVLRYASLFRRMAEVWRGRLQVVDEPGGIGVVEDGECT